MRSGLVRPLAALALGGWLGSAAIAQQPPPLTGPAPTPADAPVIADAAPGHASDANGWFVEGEGLLWRRNTTRRFLGIVDVNNNLLYDSADLTLESRMLHFDFEPGVRIRTGYDTDAGFGVDMGFFVLERSHNSQTINATTINGNSGNIFSPFPFENSQAVAVVNVFPFDFARSYNLDASSRLYGGEINGRCSIPCSVGSLTLLAGFRYLHLADNFSLTATGTDDGNPESPVTVGSYDVHATNNLYGVQVGGDFNADLTSGLRLQLSSKIGAFNNFAHQGQVIANGFLAGPVPFGLAGSAENDRFASVFEFGLFLHWWVTPAVGVNIGYQGLFITDVALAPKQLDFRLDPHAHNIIDMSGEVFYHGASAGIEVRW